METSLSGWMVVFGCRLTRAALARCALSSALARGELWNTRLDWHNCSLSVSGTSMSQQSPLLPLSWCKILGSDVHRASSPFVRPVNRATLIREVGGPLIKHPLQVCHMSTCCYFRCFVRQRFRRDLLEKWLRLWLRHWAKQCCASGEHD